MRLLKYCNKNDNNYSYLHITINAYCFSFIFHIMIIIAERSNACLKTFANTSLLAISLKKTRTITTALCLGHTNTHTHKIHM